VTFGPARETDDAGTANAQGEPVDVFAALNAERCTDPVLLHVPAGVEIPAPFVVIDWLETEAAAVFPRLAVRLGAGAGATVVEWHGSADVHALACPVTDLAVEQGAHLGQVTVQHRGQRVWQIAAQGSTVGQQASLVAAQIGLGGDYARTRTDCRLEGRGASGKLLAAYFGEGTQTLDFRTFQDHLAPDTTSNLLFKGAVGGSSRSVYTGLIHVGKHARGTNAFQTNRNLKLSEHAWAESVPNLEIENNDVRCSHASTVGPVDEEQRFYLESRGVPTAVADRLIVSGFFDEVLSQLPVSGVRGLVEGEIERRLERSERP
jgi:Fe-S cluster assembly protein SufD